MLLPRCHIPTECLTYQQPLLSMYASSASSSSSITGGIEETEGTAEGAAGAGGSELSGGGGGRDKEKESTVRMAVNCMANLVAHGSKRLASRMPAIYACLFADLCALSAYIRSNTSINRLLSSTLRSLAAVVTTMTDVSDDDFRRLLRMAKMCCFYATATLPILALGSQPSASSDSSDSSDGETTAKVVGGVAQGRDSSWRIRMHGAELLRACGGLAAMKKRLWSMQMCSFLFPMSPIFSSPSPSSSAFLHFARQIGSGPGAGARAGTEAGAGAGAGAEAGGKGGAEKLRQIFRVDVSRYTPSFLLIGITSVSLCQLLMEEAVDKVRVSLVSALSAMLDNSHLYLSAADDTDPHGSKYLTVGQQLGGTLFQLHMTLLALLQSAVTGQPLRCAAVPSDVLTAAVLSCLTKLVRNTPYARLMPGYLTEVCRFVEPCLFSEDSTVQAGALACLSAVLSTKSPLPEVSQLLQVPTERRAGVARRAGQRELPPSDPVTELAGGYGPNSTAVGVTPAFLANILFFAGQPKIHLRCAAFQVLTHLARNYYAAFDGLWDEILRHTVAAVTRSKSENVRTSALAILQAGTKAATEQKASRVTQTIVWARLLDEVVPAASSATSQSVLAACFLLLANISPALLSIFEEERKPTIDRLVAMVLRSASASELRRGIRLQALEALRPLLRYERLTEDAEFMAAAGSLLADAVAPASRLSLSLQVRACSILAAYCEALVASKERQTDGLAEPLAWRYGTLPPALVTRLGWSLAACAAHSSDKIRVSALRALGHFAYFLPVNVLEREEEEEEGRADVFAAACCRPVVEALASTNAKLLWNACYALAKMFANGLLFQAGDAAHTNHLLRLGMRQLCRLLHGTENYKIRINAALSLSGPSRNQYGEEILLDAVWPALVQAWASSDEAADFAAYRYRDTLRSQLARTLVHVVHQTEEKDVGQLQELLLEYHASVYELRCLLRNEEPPRASEGQVLDHNEEVLDEGKDAIKEVVVAKDTRVALGVGEQEASSACDRLEMLYEDLGSRLGAADILAATWLRNPPVK